ncbi:DNA repair protein RadA [Pelobacter propionicus]|uniref:DNA repair protein RadA n=1 Tax=Pelobacter propionicus (strain DSM 2379 / NBRC 103807 / OttBd1) TaxID=338966 RepID=A1AL36_PELPD|nr:DNA repair protein RadA [Pelobacter propionicus]ABK98056.1 DNA repair protein RadA [Pelobacter propionicus DSM 2379]
MKVKTVFSCQNCGCQSPKWLGKCPDCGSWNSMTEEASAPRQAAPSGERSKPIPICDVPAQSETRIASDLGELDRVLGGGIVPGSLVLIGGDPGIGKSTLLLQAMHNLAASAGQVLYVSGEESASQTRLRGERLGASHKRLLILAENSLEAIIAHATALKPTVMVIDSIQTVWTSALESAPGSVSQVRESAGKLMLLAKGLDIPVFIVGHVTKDGAIAGPRVLEHIVDTVLYFEGDGSHPFRILRAVKNRFGSTNEIGVFEMKREGLIGVENPSELFLSERPLGAPGSVVTASLEGSRPLLVELQALVTKTSYPVPRRTTIGVDHNRLALLVAVLEKKVGLHLAGLDIFLNAAGGVRLNEPAADLAMIMAVASSHLDRIIPPQTVVLGEVGLTGEVRAITQPEQRIAEAEKLGFQSCIIPAGNLRRLTKSKIRLEGVASVDEAMQLLMQ